MNQDHHVTVIGGGVIGLSVTWELTRRGFRVTLLERDGDGKSTSWAGAGILPAANLSLATDPMDRLRGLSHQLFPQWTRDLLALTGIDSQLLPCGGWFLADTPGERAAMVGMEDYWSSLGIDCAPVSSQVLAEREPGLTAWANQNKTASAWWVPGEAQVRPPRLLRALKVACREGGAELRNDVCVTEIQSDENGVTARAGGNEYRSDSVVVCGGAWTPQIASSLRIDLSIVPIRGQMLLLESATPPLQSVVNVGHRYIVCRQDGSTLVGSCEEETGFSLGTTESVLDSLHEFAVTLVPQLDSAPRVDAWSGLRPMTMDGFPMIGRATGTTNVFVAAGHFRSGLHLSPATAVVIADLIGGRQPAIDIEPFRVSRYQDETARMPSVIAP